MIISIDAEKAFNNTQHPDTKTRQSHYKKTELQANIFDEYR